MSFLSKSCVYGLRAVVYVASFAGERKFVPIHEISDQLSLSFHFLTKILQQLTEARIMESYRGPNGGIALARAAQQISLMDIVSAIDGDDMFTTCALGLTECSNKRPCPLHETWKKQRTDLMSALQKTSLEGLRDPVMRSQLRLRDEVMEKRARPL